MAEDWRLSFEAAQGAEEVARDLRATAPAGVSATRRGHTVFVYGETQELVERTAGEELRLLGHLSRWHPDRGWIDPAEWTEPEPVEPADWEVDAALPDAEAAKQLVRELERDGRSGRRAGKQVVIVGLTQPESERLA